MSMNTHVVGLLVAGVAATWPSVVGAQNPTEWPTMTSKEAQTLVASATALARNDLVAEGRDACSERGPARDPDPRPRIRVEPLKVFDNLYFIGFEQIGAWVPRTSDGLILFDTLNTPMEAETVLEPDMRQLGLDPANIKYIILSHGHWDHYGGAPYFQQKYGTPVLLTTADWDLMARPRTGRGGRGGTPPPLLKRDMEIRDGQTLTLGDTTIRFGIYPGHTPGTIMMSVPVMDRGVRRVWLIPGGALQVPNRESLQAFEHIMNDYFKPAKPEMLFNSHPLTMSDGLGHMDQIRKNPDSPNPYVFGQERMARYMDIILQCRRAWVIEKEAAGS